jgi:hypothetical protein
MSTIRLNLIQDAFDRCRQRCWHRATEWRKVNAVADVIRDVGYEVVVGVYGTGREQEGRPLGPGPWPETTLEELEMTDSGEYNYAIFSIKRLGRAHAHPCQLADLRPVGASVGEYVYGSPPIGPPWSGVTDPRASCDWVPFPPGCSDEEKLAKWPLSGHKSLPRYLANHIGELILGPGKQLVADLSGDACCGDPGGCFYNASRAEWAEYQGPERVGEGATPVGVSGCGSPDRLTFARFVDQFYLGSSDMRSSYQQWHTEHLIRTGAVNTIANTLPRDIVEALLGRTARGRLWEFIVPAELTRATQEIRHTRCMEMSVDGIQLPPACPCDEGGHRDDGSSGGGAAAAVAAVCPPNGDAPPKTEDSGSSSEEED